MNHNINTSGYARTNASASPYHAKTFGWIRIRLTRVKDAGGGNTEVGFLFVFFVFENLNTNLLSMGTVY